MGGRGSSSGKAGRVASGSKNSSNTKNKLSIDNPLIRGVPENERKDFYYHVNGATGKDLLSGKEVMIKPDAVKYENILVNADYPEISGTEKQVKYAKDLLRRAINRDIDRMRSAAGVDGNHALTDTIKQRIDTLISQTNKALNTNAETFSDVVNLSLKQKGALKFAKDNPTARAIIDRFG